MRIAQVVREQDGHILEGTLHCTSQDCLREFPIIDGIPLLIANIRQYVSDNVLPICARRDLSDFTESCSAIAAGRVPRSTNPAASKFGTPGTITRTLTAINGQ